MKYYYLIDGKIMSANEKMPEINEQWQTYNTNLLKWSESLQPCEISEIELDKVKNSINYYWHTHNNPIEVTDIISDNNGVITFKEKDCLCLKCSPIKFPNFRFNVCSICGNKRCPHASDHKYKCTNSNEPNQLGSVYQEQPKQVEEIEAVEFAAYLSVNNWESSNGIMYNKFRIEYGSKYIVTTEHIKQLYEIFKNQK